MMTRKSSMDVGRGQEFTVNGRPFRLSPSGPKKDGAVPSWLRTDGTVDNTEEEIEEEEKIEEEEEIGEEKIGEEEDKYTN
jgi:hypothetical protein